MAKKGTFLGIEPAQALQLTGVVAAMFIAVVVNVIAARHYKRWDWTKGHLYTLSPATLDTLHELSDPVEVWVLAGSAEPLEQSIKQLLVSYEAETRKLEVHFVDPDRDSAQLFDLQQRFKIETGRTEEGRVVTDAIVIVARGDRHWFLTSGDMFEAVRGDDPRAKPKEEQAITGAIRAVLRGDKVRLCFTAGHGELAIEPAREGWIGPFRSYLEKDNYELASVDTTSPDAHEPFKGCAVVVVAGPTAPFSKEEEARLRTYLLDGGDALLALGPVEAENESGMGSVGLADALAPFGIALSGDLVVETDPTLAVKDGQGLDFFATPKAHALTEGLVAETPAEHRPHIELHVVESLKHVSPAGASSASDLAVTSAKSFALASLKGAAQWTDVPEKGATDPAGPFVVAMASERPKIGGGSHGPRLVVVGSRFALAEQNWQRLPQDRGDALLMENAVSWLSARPPILDVPERPPVTAGLHVTEEARSAVRNYVLVYMPLAVALLGVVVALRRRSTEGAPQKGTRERGA
jgi:gliding motility-associatede transport system auxiliary component